MIPDDAAPRLPLCPVLRFASYLMKTLLLIAVAFATGAVLSATATETYKIAVIPKGTTHPFWKAVNAGAVKAQRDLQAAGIKVSIVWKGPLKEDDREQQIQVVENFIGQRVSGIVLAPLDRKALIAPVETAISGKIPVVIIDSGLDSKAPASYVATDNREGGRIAAHHLGRMLGGKGNVILLRYMVGSASTEDREEGFLEVMRKDFPDVRLISTDQHAGATRDTAKRVAENLISRFGKQVNGIFVPTESCAAGMLLALREADLAAGKVKLVGFDAGEMINAALKAGDLQGFVVQDPMRIGYLGVKTVVAVIRGEKVDPVIDTGVNFVTKENMNDPRIAALLNPPLDEYLK